ncbi:MAG: C-terminal helicase domain-containing protein, partial [Candidatus Ratteibacteria bacterium]
LVENIKPEDDDKLQKLIEILSKEPIKDKKILIFSAFESTVKYLCEHIKDKFEKVDYVAGGREIMTKIKRFSPQSNKANIKPEEEIKILISTEVLSEGLNLQDAQVVINYELHWNPVRIIQRIGRIDRIKSPHKEIYVYNFFPEIEAEKGINLEQKVKNRIEEIIKNFGYDEKTISLDEATVRRKLFEIYTERPEGLEEIEEKSLSKYFELEFKKLKEKYPQEYEKAKKLPNMVHIAKKDDKKGVVVFCRAGNWFKLKMVDEKGELITADDWEILKLLECKPETKGIEFDLNKLDIIERTREIFEKEANDREKDRVNIIHPVKREFEKLIAWLKRKEPESIKEEFNELLDFVVKKSLTFEVEKELRSVIRSYTKKFGLDKRQILKELKTKIHNLLQNSPDEKAEEPIYQYAEVIVVEELK